MTLPEDIYSQRILELAAAVPRTARLAAPHASATAHSKLCGSTVTIDLAMEGDVVIDYGQSVKACLLGQSAASVMGREVIGSSAEELRAVGAAMRKMLKQDGPPPAGKWADAARVRRGRGCACADRGQARGGGRSGSPFGKSCLSSPSGGEKAAERLSPGWPRLPCSR